MATFKEDISPLQLYTTRDFSGLTTTNQLANAYLTEPVKMDGVLAYAFGMTGSNVLNLLTGGIGNTRFITNRQYKWDVHGQTERAISIAQDSPDGGSTPGISQTPFRIFLEDNIFEASDNLRADDGSFVRVVNEYQDGNMWVYTVVLTDVTQEFLDPVLIKKGAKFSKMYSTVEEYSSKGGGTHYSTPMSLINQLTTLRKHYSVSRNAAKEVMVIEMRDPNDPKKSTKLWTKTAEWTALSQWMREIDRSLVYTTFNSKPVAETDIAIRGQSGFPVYHGAGFRQQISPANVQFYTNLTYQLLDDFLLKLSYSANAWGGDHKFVALTGKMGMREFDRAIREEQNARGITVTDNGTFISGKGQELTFQGAFKTVKFLNGIELTVKEFPPYDDFVHNRDLHPVTKKPVESYRFTILNFGRKNGKSNIRKVALADSENAMWHVAGSTDPMGGIAKDMNTMRASGIDGYRVELLAEVGIQVEDPTSNGELIFEK